MSSIDDASPPVSPQGEDPAAVSGSAAESGNAAENKNGVSDKAGKTIKKEGEKALEEVRKAELPKSFDD